jgi:hypothetical protein
VSCTACDDLLVRFARDYHLTITAKRSQTRGLEIEEYVKTSKPMGARHQRRVPEESMTPVAWPDSMAGLSGPRLIFQFDSKE